MSYKNRLSQSDISMVEAICVVDVERNAIDEALVVHKEMLKALRGRHTEVQRSIAMREYSIELLEQARGEQCVRHAAAEVFTPEGVDIWLRSPNRSLNNATPLQFIAAGDTDRVLQLLAQLADGAFG